MLNIELKQVNIKQKNILSNLLEKYNYEFSQYSNDNFDNNGLFGYSHLDSYFEEEDRFAYFIIVENNLAGFVLINKHKECDRDIDWSVAEFFVSFNYRNKGIATNIMNSVFNIHKGYFNIKYHPKNIASEKLWNKVAKKYSNNNYETIYNGEKYNDDSESIILIFKV